MKETEILSLIDSYDDLAHKLKYNVYKTAWWQFLKRWDEINRSYQYFGIVEGLKTALSIMYPEKYTMGKF